ncbi:hypothetical protein [Pseudomonas sp. RIT-PI-AD]|uniref:hypothetical protein n=1 Tax=Pseudomonas sp. RIT-PI-AD TaxID=3035294 RepID=UPI0021DB3E2D|nr:hypothetical protein [Pseudomonas sp. RIT-PI-AD]
MPAHSFLVLLRALLMGALLVTALPGEAAESADLAADARAFASLRQARGYFDGGAWNAELDAWQGRKHRLMQDLLARIRQGGLDAGRVRALLGAPDQAWTADSAEYAELVRATDWQGTPAGELWAYQWRGRHDRLLFAFEEGRLRASGWLYAGE